MERISSNLTLFFKFFIPVFWIVFFGSVTAAALLYDFEYVGNISARAFRIGIVLFFLSGVIVMALTLLRLKRIELGPDFLYATNYFKHFRYPYHNVAKIELSSFLFLHIGTVELKNPGSFGKRITFVASKGRIDRFLESHPERASLVQ